MVCATLSLYSHYYTAFTLLTISGFFITKVIIEKNWKLLRSFLIAQIAVSILFAPWLPTFWSQLNSNPVSWIPLTTATRIHRELTVNFLPFFFLSWTYPVFASSFGFVLARGFLYEINSAHHRRGLLRREKYLFLFVCTIVPVLLAVGVSLFKPLLVARYLIIVVPPLCVILGVNIAQHRQNYVTILLTFVLIVGILFSAYKATTIHLQQDWQEVVSYIEENSNSDDGAILILPGYQLTAFNHYYKGNLMRLDDSEAEKKIGSFNALSQLWTVHTHEYRINGLDDESIFEKIPLRIADRYALVTCEKFGGFLGVDVCLFVNRQVDH